MSAIDQIHGVAGEEEQQRIVDYRMVTFTLGGKDYGVDIMNVKEISKAERLTLVPNTAPYVRGVINLRGQVIPVVDLRAKFCMTTEQTTTETCIIVVETRQGQDKFSTGIVVDRVRDVLDITGEQIEDAPSFGTSVETDFILGMGKIADSVKILLDIDRVLGSSDLTGIFDAGG